MIEFEEPGKGYILQGSNITKTRPKIRLIILLVLFISVVGFFVKNDYDFNFFETNKIVANFDCSNGATFNQHDTNRSNYETAKYILEKNDSLLKSEASFKNAQVLFEEGVEESNANPIIHLYFSGDTTLKIPEKICGFNANVFYK